MVSVHTYGPMALFTRPEFKTERVSYDVIPPTAAVGLLEAILWKPEFQWRIRQIKVLKPILFMSVRRNEIKTGFPMRFAGQPTLDINANRVQRHSMFLRDVNYEIEADITLTEKGIEGGNTVTKYVEIFQRRLRSGQHYRVPYFGTRECVATVEPVESPATPIKEDRPLGLTPLVIRHGPDGPVPQFFPAIMMQGVIEVPYYDHT